MEFSRFDFHAMGGACALQLYAPEQDLAVEVAQAVFDEVNRIETRYSRYHTILSSNIEL
ncbi:MAG: hypothetical protein HQL87_17260 [Magnetococcales bacterium]|nr:hypothetical protein [Magnetococcales bacterium]